MKNLFLLIVLAVVGYWAYIKYQTPEPEPEPEPLVAEAQRRPVSMGVKKSVRALLEEWKSRTLSTSKGHVSKIAPERELAEVRRDLFSRGIYSEIALQEEVKRALLELGVAAREVNEISKTLVEMADLPQQDIINKNFSSGSN